MNTCLKLLLSLCAAAMAALPLPVLAQALQPIGGKGYQPIFNVTHQGRLVVAACDTHGPFTAELLPGATALSSIRRLDAAPCDPDFQGTWTQARNADLLFSYQGLWRYQVGTGASRIGPHAGHGPAINLSSGLLVFSTDASANGQKTTLQTVDTASGQTQALRGTGLNGESCELLSGGYALPLPADAALYVTTSSCTNTQSIYKDQFAPRLLFTVDASGATRARPDLEGCRAFAAQGDQLYALCYDVVSPVGATLIQKVGFATLNTLQRLERTQTHYEIDGPLNGEGPELSLRSLEGEVVFNLRRFDSNNLGVCQGADLWRIRHGVPEKIYSDNRNAGTRVNSTSRTLYPFYSNDGQNPGYVFYDSTSGRVQFQGHGGSEFVNPPLAFTDLPGTALTFFSQQSPVEADGLDRGAEPWILDRSNFQMRLLADLNTSGGFGSNGSSHPKMFSALDGKLYFWARTSQFSNAYTLFASQGRSGDVQVVAPIPGTATGGDGSNGGTGTDGGSNTGSNDSGGDGAGAGTGNPGNSPGTGDSGSQGAGLDLTLLIALLLGAQRRRIRDQKAA